jgi:hypothetical protein
MRFFRYFVVYTDMKWWVTDSSMYFFKRFHWRSSASVWLAHQVRIYASLRNHHDAQSNRVHYHVVETKSSADSVCYKYSIAYAYGLDSSDLRSGK